jgi:nicotinamide mononucleotide adenylyltransferase
LPALNVLEVEEVLVLVIESGEVATTVIDDATAMKRSTVVQDRIRRAKPVACKIHIMSTATSTVLAVAISDLYVPLLSILPIVVMRYDLD